MGQFYNGRELLHVGAHQFLAGDNSHRKRRANAQFTEETRGRGRRRRAEEDQAAGVTVKLATAWPLEGTRGRGSRNLLNW